jgi:hypothetical protein
VGQVAVDQRVLGLSGAALFVSSGLFFAMLGLKWRQFWALARGDGGSVALYSCGGAVAGSLIGAILSLVVLDRAHAWLQLSVPFVLASIVYYGVGKVGCIQLRCCESVQPGDLLRLPVSELIASMLIAVIAAGLLTLRAASAEILVCVAILFATIRALSRLKRGHGWSRCLKSVDVIGVYGIAVAALTFVVRGG